jgi:hypothetical protein
MTQNTWGSNVNLACGFPCPAEITGPTLARLVWPRACHGANDRAAWERPLISGEFLHRGVYGALIRDIDSLAERSEKLARKPHWTKG